MYINVHYVDLSETIFVQRSLWKKTVELKTVLDYYLKEIDLDKIFVNGDPISKADLGRKLYSFEQAKTILGEYELQIEKRK